MSETENKQETSVTEASTHDLPDFKTDPSAFLRASVESELKKSGVDTGSNDNKSDNTRKISKVEEEAMNKGWLPKELFKGDEDNWVSAPQFLKTRSLIENSKSQSEQIKSLQAKIDKLYDIAQIQAQTSAKQRSEEILAKKRDEIKAGNIDEAEKYEKLYHELQSQIQKPTDYASGQPVQQNQNQTQQALDPEVMQFMERNRTWYNDTNPINSAMSAYAYQMNEIMRREYPQWDVSRRLGEVELAVKRQFPAAFHNPARDADQSVEGSRRAPETVSYPQFESLPRKWQDMIDTFVRNPAIKMTREEYIKELVATGALKVS